MAFLAVNSDGSTTELGTITGYRVVYQCGRRKLQSKPFTFLWQALGFQKHLAMGSNSQLVPIYSKKG